MYSPNPDIDDIQTDHDHTSLIEPNLSDCVTDSIHLHDTCVSAVDPDIDDIQIDHDHTSLTEPNSLDCVTDSIHLHDTSVPAAHPRSSYIDEIQTDHDPFTVADTATTGDLSNETHHSENSDLDTMGTEDCILGGLAPIQVNTYSDDSHEATDCNQRLHHSMPVQGMPLYC
jgi:hypothetical protein